MAEIEIVVYLSVFLLSVFLTFFTLNQKSIVTSFLAWISWFALAGFNLAFLYDSVFLTVSWLYFVFGAVFLIYGFALVVMSMQGKPDKDLVLA